MEEQKVIVEKQKTIVEAQKVIVCALRRFLAGLGMTGSIGYKQAHFVIPSAARNLKFNN